MQSPFLSNPPESSSQPEGEQTKIDKGKKTMSLKNVEEESTKSDSNDETTHVPSFTVESAKVEAARRKSEIRKEELIDLLGPGVVNKKGLVTLKVYREDDTSKIIPEFKASDLHLGEWREVVTAFPNKKGKGWNSIYKQIQERIDYLRTTEAELGLDRSLSEQDPLDKLNDLANKKRKHADDIHDFFKANKRLKSSVHYKDHPAGTVLNESVLALQVLRRLGSIFTSVYAAIQKLKKDSWKELQFSLVDNSKLNVVYLLYRNSKGPTQNALSLEKRKSRANNQNPNEKVSTYQIGRLDTETRRKVDFKGPIPSMTPTRGIEAIKELSEHSLSCYKEGNIKDEDEELQVVLNQICLRLLYLSSSSFDLILDSLIPLAKRRTSTALVTKLVIAASVYFIWRERNDRLFNNNKRTVAQVIECIFSVVRLKLMSCRFKKSKISLELLERWKLPELLLKYGFRGGYGRKKIRRGGGQKSPIEREREREKRVELREEMMREERVETQTKEGNIDTSKALDASLVDTKSSVTESGKQNTSSSSGNDVDADDADIKPIYDEEPMAEVQLTGDNNVFAAGQQHTEQPEFNNEVEVDQNAKQCHDIRPLPAKLTNNQTTELSNQSLESENTSLKEGQHGQFSKVKSKEAKFASQVDVNNDLSKPVTPHYLPKIQESSFVKPHHVIASSESRNSSKNMPRFSSNDMVHNHYLEEAKKKTHEIGRNSRPNMMSSAKSQSTANDSKLKPRRNNQKSRNLASSETSYITTKTVPIAEHYRNSRNFFDTKHFVCSTCQKCVFNANHDSYVTNFLNEVNSHANVPSNKTTNRNKPVEQITIAKKLERQIPTRYRWVPTRKIFPSSTTTVDSEPPHGSNTYITNLHECMQNLDSSAGASINVQEEQTLDLNAYTPFNLKKERIKA
ncbi:hypothetical protein Tco_0790430 [Tanacetum coccineum]